ncbi:MAG TPA: hypothetical protein VGF94_21370 [Kofleriaceae bacterium]
MASAPGYLTNVTLAIESPGNSEWGSQRLLSDAEASQYLATEAEFTYPATDTGFVQAVVVSLTPATATLVPASGLGPVYVDTSEIPTPTLTDTAESSQVLFGNVVPGLYDLSATDPGTTCAVKMSSGLPSEGWAPTQGGGVGLVVIPGGFTTGVTIYCR